MNIQTMLDRLQCDMLSIYGIAPQLSVSRIPLYEGLWKELLVLIENIGDYGVVDVQAIGAAESERVLGSRNAASFDVVIVWAARNAEAFRLGYYVCVPKELTDLLYVFWYTGLPVYLRALRQICLFTYKSRSNEITQTQTDGAVSGFIERNARCRLLSNSYYRLASDGTTVKRRSERECDTSQTLKIARLLWRMVTTRWDYRDIKPSHGPGAVADAKQGISKWKKIDHSCSRISDKTYPVSEYFCPSPGDYDYSRATWCDSTSKLAIVPKDKRGPRIICTQPSSAMWIQQGQRRSLEACIERSRLLKTSRFRDVSSSIKFDNQEQNGSLALESSRTRELATIDLSDASDLVSWGLIQYLSHKEVLRALAATRSMYVRLPSKELVKLHMYAPMGSAMCFPVESLVFWVIATAAMHVYRGWCYEHVLSRPGALKALTTEEPRVFVFGDDILVPREGCKFVCERMTDIGFKPNLGKTFADGFYRESCGVDAYKGSRLDICRLQVHTIASMPDAYATIDLANRARRAGMLELSTYLECQVESYLGFGLAAGNNGSSTWERGFPCDRWGANQLLTWNMSHKRRVRFNPNLQRWEAWSIVARPRTERAPQDGRYRLFRGLTTGVSEHTTDWLSPDSTQYYLGWVAAF